MAFKLVKNEVYESIFSYTVADRGQSNFQMQIYRFRLAYGSRLAGSPGDPPAGMGTVEWC